MYAVEFETRIKDGIVRIPGELQNFYSADKAKIIIMVDEKYQNKNQPEMDFIEQLTHHPRHLGEAVVFLSRDQANER